MARLITIPFSHYCEKARWALERCGVDFVENGHLPLFHRIAVRRAGGGRSVPVLVDGGTTLADSTDIVAWADRQSPGALLPVDPATRTAALALEDEFDVQLGPATRRVAYSYMLPRDDLGTLLDRGVPGWEARALRLVGPIAKRMMKRSLNVTPAGVARSIAKVDESFARVGAVLADGRRYLAGDLFSVADLTFASLAAVLLSPPEFAWKFDVDLGAAATAQIDRWRATPAGQLVARLYREDRRVRLRAA